MNLQTLLGDIPISRFTREYFHRLPFALPGTAHSLCPLGTWDVLGKLLVQPGVDVMVVRQGERFDGPCPTSGDAAKALNDQGYTILLRHAERHHPQLKALARAFEDDFHAPANIHIYATPAGKYGFSWHYDAEDVFIVQTSGQKEYSLRKNTVHPWPLVETIPHDMGYQREIMPMLRTLLVAGDWLYIPCGYWHKAEARGSGEPAISLALGVLSPSALSLYDFLRPRLARSLLWRQRLPVRGGAAGSSPEELEAAYRMLFRQLADDLAQILRDDSWMREFLQSPRLCSDTQ
jgi:ribosomal protein L16 Arg81 hydroxylase